MELFRPSVSTVGALCILFAAACSYAAPAAEGRRLSVIESKLDPELLRRLEELSNLGQLDQRLSVLIRTSSEINSDQENLLQSRGMIIDSRSGVILSATIPAKSIQDVAAMEFVLRIELAKKLKKR